MLNKKNSVLLLLVGVLSLSNLWADYSPYQFLRLQSSARSAGLAGCFVSMPNDASALYFNPATISTVENKRFSATFLKHVLDINSGLVSYIKPIEDIGVFAASVSYINYGSFDRADNTGRKNGTFGAGDLSFAATYSNILDTNLYYGVSLKYIVVSIENESTSSLAVDAGILYRLKDERTNIGLSVLHAGTQLSKFGGTTESLPLDIRAGINHRLKGLPLLVNLTFHHLADNSDSFFDKFKNFALGGELYIGEYVMLRLGFDNQVRRMTSIESDKKLSGFSGGLGIKANDFTFDYGAAIFGTGATDRKSVV